MQQDPVMLISAVIGPSYNTDIITAALEICHGDVDAAVNNLLDPLSSRSSCNNTADEPALPTATNSTSCTQSLPGPSSATTTLSISSSPGSPANSLPGPSSLDELLYSHTRKILKGRTYDLEIDRSCLWRQASVFYKNSLHSPDCLSYKLMVTFVEEEGVDAGESITHL